MLRDFYVNRFLLSGIVCRDVEIIDSSEDIIAILYISTSDFFCENHIVYSFGSIAKFVLDNVLFGSYLMVDGRLGYSSWYDSECMYNYESTLIAKSIEIF